jgi:hypothetical protein
MLFSKFSSPYTVKVVEDYLPREMEKKVLYIVVDDGYMEQAAMICPCGCRKILQMNMLPDERPCWRLKKNIDGSHSLNPSIWRKKDCFSHFWFKNNRVHWCRGGGPWWNRF